ALAGLLHRFFEGWHAGGEPLVRLAVEADDRAGELRHVVDGIRIAAVEDDCRVDVGVRDGGVDRGATTPAKPHRANAILLDIRLALQPAEQRLQVLVDLRAGVRFGTATTLIQVGRDSDEALTRKAP